MRRNGKARLMDAGKKDTGNRAEKPLTAAQRRKVEELRRKVANHPIHAMKDIEIR